MQPDGLASKSKRLTSETRSTSGHAEEGHIERTIPPSLATTKVITRSIAGVSTSRLSVSAAAQLARCPNCATSGRWLPAQKRTLSLPRIHRPGAREPHSSDHRQPQEEALHPRHPGMAISPRSEGGDGNPGGDRTRHAAAVQASNRHIQCDTLGVRHEHCQALAGDRSFSLMTSAHGPQLPRLSRRPSGGRRRPSPSAASAPRVIGRRVRLHGPHRRISTGRGHAIRVCTVRDTIAAAPDIP